MGVSVSVYYSGYPPAWSSGRKAERDPNIKVTERGTRLPGPTGSAVIRSAKELKIQLYRSPNGKGNASTAYDEIPHGSKFVLTDVGDRSGNQFWLEIGEKSNSESDIAKSRQMIEWTRSERAYTLANRNVFLRA